MVIISLIWALNPNMSDVELIPQFFILSVIGIFLGYILATKVNKLSEERKSNYIKIVVYIAITIFVIGFIMQIIQLLLS